MDHSTPASPAHHQLPELAQTHVHRVNDAIQLSHPLSSPSPPALNLFQHQGSFPMSQFFPSGGQSVEASASASILPMNIQDWFLLGLIGLNLPAVQGTLKSLLQHHSSKASILWCSAFLMVQLSHPYQSLLADFRKEMLDWPKHSFSFPVISFFAGFSETLSNLLWMCLHHTSCSFRWQNSWTCMPSPDSAMPHAGCWQLPFCFSKNGAEVQVPVLSLAYRDWLWTGFLCCFLVVCQSSLLLLSGVHTGSWLQCGVCGWGAGTARSAWAGWRDSVMRHPQWTVSRVLEESVPFSYLPRVLSATVPASSHPSYVAHDIVYSG